MIKAATTKENVLYILNLALSLLVLYWIYRIISRLRTSPGAITTVTIIVTYLAIIIVYIFFAKGLLIGHFRGNGIRISQRQFGEVYRIYQEELHEANKYEPSLSERLSQTIQQAQKEEDEL